MATEPDKLNIGAVATLVAVLALAMVAIVAVLTAMVRNEVDREVSRKGGTANDRDYRSLAAAQHTQLTEEARWTDRDAGVLSIPIERSMQIVVDEVRREPELATAQTADAGVADAAVEDGGEQPDAQPEDDDSAGEGTQPPPKPKLTPPPSPPRPIPPGASVAPGAPSPPPVVEPPPSDVP